MLSRRASLMTVMMMDSTCLAFVILCSLVERNRSQEEEDQDLQAQGDREVHHQRAAVVVEDVAGARGDHH